MCPVISSPVIREMGLANSCATNRHATRTSSIWRLAVLASVLVCACESAGPSVLPAALSSDRRTAEPFPTAPVPTTPLGPIAVALPSPTPCSRPAPSLVPALVYQNGNLDLNVPYRLGLVRFNLWPCRDIEVVRTKYGLGPAARVINEPSDPNSDPDDIRSRYYAASVPVGQEAAFVTRLVGHPEDFQYVEFAFIPTGGVPEVPFVYSSTVEPKEGPAGTSFKLRICCLPEGTSVTKTFAVPSGPPIVIRDTARADRTVPAGWGGSADDVRGVYTVTVTSDEIGSIVRFRIT